MLIFSQAKKLFINLYGTIRYIFVFIKCGVISGKTSFKGCNGKTISVLANGPSLKEALNSKTFVGEDLIVVNYFAYDDAFYKLKPEHYCLVDPMFFYTQHNFDKVKKLYSIFNDRVNWQLNLYIPSKYYKDFKYFSQISNEYINIVAVNNITYEGFKSLEYHLYKAGFSSPIFYTVANMAEYVAINLGYKIIKLYGVDHTFFDGLTVNDNNQVCCQQVHFYEDPTKTEYIPIRRNDNGQYWKMADYIHSIANMFGSHDVIAKYADFIGGKILNCTKGSLIDSFDRIIDE